MVKPNGKDLMSCKDDEMLTDNFDSRSEGKLDIICNIVFVLPIEYETVIGVEKEEHAYLVEEMTNHKPLCFYVTNNGCIEEEKVSFERSDEGMK